VRSPRRYGDHTALAAGPPAAGSPGPRTRSTQPRKKQPARHCSAPPDIWLLPVMVGMGPQARHLPRLRGRSPTRSAWVPHSTSTSPVPSSARTPSARTGAFDGPPTASTASPTRPTAAPGSVDPGQSDRPSHRAAHTSSAFQPVAVEQRQPPYRRWGKVRTIASRTARRVVGPPAGSRPVSPRHVPGAWAARPAQEFGGPLADRERAGRCLSAIGHPTPAVAVQQPRW